MGTLHRRHHSMALQAAGLAQPGTTTTLGLNSSKACSRRRTNSERLMSRLVPCSSSVTRLKFPAVGSLSQA